MKQNLYLFQISTMTDTFYLRLSWLGQGICVLTLNLPLRRLYIKSFKVHHEDLITLPTSAGRGLLSLRVHFLVIIYKFHI